MSDTMYMICSYTTYNPYDLISQLQNCTAIITHKHNLACYVLEKVLLVNLRLASYHMLICNIYNAFLFIENCVVSKTFSPSKTSLVNKATNLMILPRPLLKNQFRQIKSLFPCPRKHTRSIAKLRILLKTDTSIANTFASPHQRKIFEAPISLTRP